MSFYPRTVDELLDKSAPRTARSLSNSSRHNMMPWASWTTVPSKVDTKGPTQSYATPRRGMSTYEALHGGYSNRTASTRAASASPMEFRSPKSKPNTWIPSGSNTPSVSPHPVHHDCISTTESSTRPTKVANLHRIKELAQPRTQPKIVSKQSTAPTRTRRSISPITPMPFIPQCPEPYPQEDAPLTWDEINAHTALVEKSSHLRHVVERKLRNGEIPHEFADEIFQLLEQTRNFSNATGSPRRQEAATAAVMAIRNLVTKLNVL
eukprot:PhF_6_TR42384/c0_g1_i1/m.63937